MVQPPPPPDDPGPTSAATGPDQDADRRRAALLAALGSALALESAALYSYDRQLRLLAGYGPAGLAAVDLPLDASLPGRAILGRRGLQLPADAGDLPADLAPPGGAPALCLPLLIDGEPLGVLYVARPAGAAPFSPADLLLASLAADREAATIQLDRLGARLHAHERISAQVIESIPSSLVVIDPQLRVVSVNRNFLDKARRDARSTIGRRVAEIFPAVLARYLRLDTKVQAVLRSGQPFPGERISYRAPGLPARILFYRLIPLRGKLGVEHVLLLMDDITERERLGEEVRRAERHLASVVECASDLVISLDPAGQVVTWNRAAERTSGLRADLARGRSLASLCAPGQRHLIDAMIARLARGQESQRVEVDLLVGDDGSPVPIAWSGSPMGDDQGHVAALVVVGYDLTERRRLEQQLIQSAKSASLGVMASGIAHEIRNPLGIIAASAQLLLEQPCADPLHSDGAERIYSAARRAATIIEEMLRFARPDRAPPRPLDLHALIGEALALVTAQPLMRGIALRRELDPNPPIIYGNAGLLRQVLINLLLNACQAMPDGGTLAISTAREDDLALVSVADSGCGIEPDLIGQIFDPFFTTRPVGQGSGLGLAISDSIVRQHQGLIQVDSRPGLGSRFTVRLPLSDTGLPAAPEP